MTALQEASTKALDALRKAMQGNLDFDVALEAFEALRTALAQQELRQKERPDFMAGYDAGMTDAKRMAQQREQQPVCHGCGIPAGDVHMSTCKSGKWPSRVSNGDTAAPAPVPAQGVGRTNPGDETGGAVERFGWQTFLGKSPKIVPATNGSFVWYSDYLKLWQSAQPEDGCAPNHMCNGHRVHIPTGECCNKCGATSW